MLHTADPNGVDKLRLIEMFCSRERVQGAVSDFRIDDNQISISFRAPGYTADIFVDRGTGKYDVSEVRSGFIAVMNDLHKGRDIGKVWGAAIDICAILLVLVSATGLILIWFIHKRRTSGLILAAAVALACWLLYRLLVPQLICGYEHFM